ncbi:MAG TPA: hypothetical protein VJP85_00105 [Candidatus Baltobacteraceae bacterium]|nr:hypothetical protein [Candidatus Baltobacteraceae bacterium]
MRYSPALLIAFLLVCIPGRAEALPVFAHRFGLSCQACHTTVPHLNSFGEAFARNGFRLPRAGRDVVPVAVKVKLAYTSAAEEGLPKAVVDEVELLSGGAIGSAFNYFLEQYAVDGGMPGLPRDAWVQYNGNAGTHVRAGQFTLPLPVDPETQRDTESHYLVYDQKVGENPFNFFDPHIGVELYRESPSGDALHLAALSSYDRQSGNPVSGIDLMASGTKNFGDFTLYAYRYQGQRQLGGLRDAFFRQAFGAGQRFGKFDLVAVTQRGKDRGADSSGGFAEGRYAFSSALMAVARYDRVWDSLSGAQQQTVLSFITRPARNMRFTVEDQITDRHTLNTTLLFAY